MNTYQKFVPNVYLAKCEEKHEKGDEILVTTKYGKENECIVFNLIFERDGFYYYSIVRADGKCGLTFDGLDFKTLLSKYYSRYIELVQDMYLITVTVELNALDLKNIDYTYPVYFKQFGRYFGIVDIQANSADDNCEVTLMRLSAG